MDDYVDNNVEWLGTADKPHGYNDNVDGGDMDDYPDFVESNYFLSGYDNEGSVGPKVKKSSEVQTRFYIG